ncbi:MAG: polyhydroxyalkanoate depolymerase [Gammaproteobacteria bacterium]|nr:polyhydroxyalkanoate depolymerase [Gammaproteobacteria bacterium]
MLYQMQQNYTAAISPLNVWMKQLKSMCNQPWSPLNYSFAGKTVAAAAELVERHTGEYGQPEFNIDFADIDGNKIAIKEEIAVAKPYCNLINFKRNGNYDHPKVLLIAPLSGHYSTLLRGTVEHFISDHDVYITSWINARDVPLSDGDFSFDDYITYVMEFCQFLGDDFHIIAVCQPTVPTIVATSVMAQQNVSYQPKSISLLGGPVDTRVSPTEVNNYAVDKELAWFEKNVICTVPDKFAGAGQRVYPGFIQLSGFMSMNLDSHINKHFSFFGDLIKGDGDSAENHRRFYNEYLAVMDMPEKFYLDTVKHVFIEHNLPKGEMTYLGKLVDSTAVTKVALLTIEGEHDDITGDGQTQAAHQILSAIPADKKHHHTQSDVGHYGIFNGRRFRQEIGPMIKKFIQDHS